jgi:hypothetical protein
MNMFMPENPKKDFIKRAQLFITDDDESVTSNKRRWSFIESTYEKDGCNLFSNLDYREALTQAKSQYIQAAAFMADMRAEFLLQELDRDNSNLDLHRLYLKNLIWATRLRFFLEVNSIPDNNRKVTYQ